MDRSLAPVPRPDRSQLLPTDVSASTYLSRLYGPADALPLPSPDERSAAPAGPVHYLPMIRGSVVHARPSPSGRLEVPRSLEYLSSLRVLDRPMPASDAAVLEILLGAAYEADPSFRAGSHALPLASIIHILGGFPSGKPLARRREVETSLDRLTRTTLQLPGTPIPTVRRSRVIGLDVVDDDQGNPLWLRRFVAVRGALGSYSAEAVALERAATEAVAEVRDHYDALPDRAASEYDLDAAQHAALDPLLSGLERRLGLPVYDVDSSWIGRKPHVRREPDRGEVDPCLADVPRVSQTPAWWSADPKAAVTFSPILRWTIQDGFILFEIDGYLSFFLDAYRTVGRRRQPFAYLDLGAVAAFKGKYSAAIYRRVLAGAMEDVVLRRWSTKRGERRIVRKRMRIGTFHVSVPIETMIEDFSMSWAPRLGARTQLEAIALGTARRDFETTRPGGLTITPVGPVGAPGRAGDVRIEVVHVPSLKALRTARHGSGDRLTSDESAFWSPPDQHELWVRPSTFFKIADRFGLDRDQLVDLVRAWRFAVFESRHPDHHRLGDLTGRAYRSLPHNARSSELIQQGEASAIWGTRPADVERRYRGKGLIEAIEVHGTNRAAVLWAAEEMSHPDLWHGPVLAVLAADGTEARADLERQVRAARRMRQEEPELLTGWWDPAGSRKIWATASREVSRTTVPAELERDKRRRKAADAVGRRRFERQMDRFRRHEIQAEAAAALQAFDDHLAALQAGKPATG